MEKNIDARGLMCPQPVILTKRALAEQNTDKVTTLVDNRTAMNNLKAFAESKGYQTAIKECGNEFQIMIIKNACGCELMDFSKKETDNNTVILINSDGFGTGDPEFSSTLMRNFIFSLGEVSPKPQTMLFINSGVNFTIQGSPVLDTLHKLEQQGTEILSCGSCLDFYELKDKLDCGIVTNMYTIAEKLMSADKIIKP